MAVIAMLIIIQKARLLSIENLKMKFLIESQTANFATNAPDTPSLVSNAVLYWNTVKMSGIVNQLKANGEDISDKALSHISLLAHRHVVPMGTYFVDGDFDDE